MNRTSWHWRVMLAAVTAVWVWLVLRQCPALLISAQTGRILPQQTQPAVTENFTSPTSEITQPSEAQPSEAVLSFSAQDAYLVELDDRSGIDADIPAMLEAELRWDLTGAEPTVLIVHTHGSESYTGDYDQVEPYRTLDDSQNMISIGDEVARVLELGGISVIHDRTIYDYPDYNGAYSAARVSIADYLSRYPSILLVLDLHRDASGSGSEQVAAVGTVGGQRAARLMLVVGSDHQAYGENLSLAVKLAALLERSDPGITRSVAVRSKVYNQDLTTGALLVEVGTAGNTRQEAVLAANALARAILKMAKGNQ